MDNMYDSQGLTDEEIELLVEMRADVCHLKPGLTIFLG